MTIQYNDICSTSSSTVQKCKNNPPTLLAEHFSELLAEFVSIVTDDKKEQDIVSNLNNSLLESDEIADDKHSGMYGYPQFALVQSKLYADMKHEYTLANVQASSYIHKELTGFFENSSSAKHVQESKLTASAESDDRTKHFESNIMRNEISYNVKSLKDESKTELSKDSLLIKLNENNLLEELTHLEIFNSDLKSVHVSELILSEGEVFEVNEQPVQPNRNVPDNKMAGVIKPESVLRFDSSEPVASEQKKSVSESLAANMDLVLHETQKYGLEAGIVVRNFDMGIADSSLRNESGLPINSKRTGELLQEKEISFEEIHAQPKKSLDELVSGLKQSNGVVSEEYRQSSDFESSDNNFGKIQVLEKAHVEQPEFLFRNILSQTANPNELVVQAVQSIEKHTAKADVIMQIAVRLTVMSHDGRAEMEVQIHPENLGKVLLKVVNENGLYSAQITAETYQAKELLQSHLSELKTTLKEQGFNFFRLDVGFADSQSNNRRWFTQNQFYAKGSGRLTTDAKDQFTDIVGKNYIKAKMTGHIDCLV